MYRFIIISLLLALSPFSHAEQRIALLIGNSDYPKQGLFSPLGKNPLNDVEAMASKLKQFGFRIVRFDNANLAKMDKEIATFNSIPVNSTVLFYYSGHGVHHRGKDENYLIPVGRSIRTHGNIPSYGVSANALIRDLEASPAAMRIVLLDVCRDYVGATKG